MNTELNTVDDRLKDFADIWAKMDGDDDLVIKNQPLMAWLNSEGFFTAPASTKYHGAYEGGLYEHSRMVAMRLYVLTINNNLKWQRPESPFIVGMFHDLCKCDQYILKESPLTENFNGQEVVLHPIITQHYEYNTNTLLKGHGSKSVMLLSQFINLTEEEMLCIRYHMGPYEKEEWSEFDAAIKKYETVYWSHAADMLASKVDGV